MVDIPRYKRDRYIFISNLNNITANSDHQITLNREGYLLSEQFTNNRKIELAHWVRKRRNLLVSDNGNFSRMKVIANIFKEDGSALLSLAINEFKDNGELSENIFKAREDLIAKITVACREELSKLDVEKVIERQVVIKPNYLIGLEDYTIPVLMLCGMTDPIFQPKPKAVKIFQEKTYDLYKRQLDGEFGHKKVLDKTINFLVLHAYDYASAFQGAKQLPVNPEALAISYGGPMSSRRWITSLHFGNKVENFAETLPEPYLVATALTMGAVNGLNSDVPIHILGVGSPIMIALIGQLLVQSRAVSIDSTAPFKDSNIGKLYGSRYAFLKMKMLKVAAYALINNKPYTSRTPYFKQFEKDFPSNWPALRSELGITTSTNINVVIDLLESRPDLVEVHIPFFSRMRSGNDPMIERLRIDRAGHNYWILRNICISVRNKMQHPKNMEKWMRYQVERYNNVGSKKWSRAVETAFELSIKYRKQL